MASGEGRRAFLLGVTLNELSFIMFFLLMFISAATLQESKTQLKKEIQQKKRIEQQLAEVLRQHDETFKRLQLLETKLMRAAGFSVKPSEEQLDQLFSSLQAVNAKNDLQQIIVKLKDELKSYKRLDKVIAGSGLKAKSAQQIEQLLTQGKRFTEELQSLKGRLAYTQRKLKNSGLGYPPCWADSQTGAVEYLYTITLYQQKMRIEAAWPKHRNEELALIPGARELENLLLNQQQFKQGIKPVFAWSQAHDCRHFVRIKDDKSTSKEAFKRQMLVIEDYFYKYLVR